jgi:hypothetical protein
MVSQGNPGRAKISPNASSLALADETFANRLPTRIVIDLSRVDRKFESAVIGRRRDRFPHPFIGHC